MSKNTRSLLSLGFERLGTTNGTAPPKEGDNMDPFLHEGMIAADLKSMATKRWDNWLDKVKEDEEFGLKTRIAQVAAGTTSVILTSRHYSLSLQVKNPAVTLDKTKLETEMRKAGIAQDKAKAIIAAASKTNAPAKTFSVSPIVP